MNYDFIIIGNIALSLTLLFNIIILYKSLGRIEESYRNRRLKRPWHKKPFNDHLKESEIPKDVNGN
jgi:hypothetical protein